MIALLKRKILVQLVLIFISISCWMNVLAQAPFLSATASKSTVSVGENFQLTYSLNASGKNFRGPELGDFIVLGGPNQSTSMQYVNGNFSQSVSFTYIVQAKLEGSFKISPATVEVEGKKVASNIINLTVVKGNSQAQNPTQKGNSQQQNSGNGLTDKNIFIRVLSNKSSVLEGEAITVTYKLYTNVSILNYSINKAPALTGFWNQDIEVPQPPQLTREVVDGIAYNTAIIKKQVLFPQQSGTLTLDPIELECIARIKVKSQRGNDPFGMFNDPFFNDAFFGSSVQDVKYSFKSNPTRITVRELPGIAPSTFAGAVGKLNFEATLDKTTTKENEPISLKIKINGSGNLKLASLPEINFPPDLETYDPKNTDNYKASDAGVSGSKTIEYLIIPRREGEYELEPITFTYFDLEKKQYVSKTKGPFKIKVGRGIGGGSATATNNGVSKSEFQLIGKDIRYIKVSDPSFDDSANNFFGSLPFFSLILFPLIAVGGAAYYLKRKAFLEGNTVLMKSRNATALAKKRLSVAEKHLKEGKNHLVFEEISKSLWEYASNKLTIPLSELSKDTISAQLIAKKATSETVNNLLQTIQSCEMAQYAGLSASATPDSLYQQAIQVITKLEGEISA